MGLVVGAIGGLPAIFGRDSNSDGFAHGTASLVEDEAAPVAFAALVTFPLDSPGPGACGAGGTLSKDAVPLRGGGGFAVAGFLAMAGGAGFLATIGGPAALGATGGLGGHVGACSGGGRAPTAAMGLLDGAGLLARPKAKAFAGVVSGLVAVGAGGLGWGLLEAGGGGGG